MGRINSRRKGKAGELQWAHFLSDHGYKARRGQQFAGGTDSPDVLCPELPFHFEVKRVEKLNMRDAVAQAAGDSKGKPWAVAHRWNDGKWLITMDAETWIELLEGRIEMPKTVKEEVV